ncbi:helix-turn-helix transcriptional regulator [Paenibacillus alvei]|uniref:helix-turn-helix domain-containing protein n=1 Tax=Paenibacillus alvei TaxID=44250 RepID=UPI002283F271|nr:helix-turn-helix transcriptional regulator [Paenibacillus alvei]MCY9541812.1 helix-turn-helix transcriptional regulator [Paenibacillus alvei]MCY9705000.1 helix-turn-helix transcriptional regulator [Paenibacillus alvei]MEC0082491.1 helix-turn-helix transcriptional regulator [Paenibacillus alvei]
MAFPSRLKQLRTQNKMTQEELGKKINVTKVSISGYENGNRSPDTDTLQRIAEVFNVSMDYLFGRTDDSSPRGQDINAEELEFEAFINNPEHGIFFKEYLEAPEERKKELMMLWKMIKDAEKGRKLGDRQGD